MLRHASVQTRPVLLLDFLAPSLIQATRAHSTKPHPARQAPQPRPKKTPFPLQASSTSSLFAKLRTNVHTLSNSPDQYPGHHLPPDKVQRFNQTISKIRKALECNYPDEDAVLKHWQTLDELKLIHLLNHTHLAPLSNLMIRSFLTPWKKKGQTGKPKTISVDPLMKKLVENVALLAARGDSLDALNALMRHHIHEEDPQAILALYDKFMSLIGDKDLTMKHSPDAETVERGEVEGGMGEVKESLATDTELKSSHVSVAAGRVHLVLAAVTAHAMKDSFKGALDLCLSTVIQLDHATSQTFLQIALADKSALRNKVKRYISRLGIAKLVSRPGVFSTQVGRLGSSRSTEDLEKLYGGIIEGLSGEDAYLAADPSLVTDTKTVALTNVGWTALLTAFFKCERKDLAGKLWDDMTHFGVYPGVSMWTALIDAYEQIRAVDSALEVWNMMLQQGIEPDALAYRAIISALFKGRRPNQAMEMFNKYKKTIPVVESDPHHLSVYNTVLHGLCASDGAAEAEKLREDMERHGPKPDIVAYNTFINYYGRRGKFQGIAATLRVMKEAGLNGDVFTYTTILSALLKAGKTEAADLVLALMDKQGVERNVALYTSLIDHQLREGKKENFHAAMRMLQMMEQDLKNPPNEITYTSILTGLYRIGWMEPEELVKWETDIINRLRRRGISLGLPAYHLLLKACLVYPHENGVHQALAYFEEMKRREIPIINTTWYILLAGLLNREQWEIADKLVAEMYASGIHPMGSLLRLVHKIHNRVI